MKLVELGIGFNYTGYPEKITLEPGSYVLECWGAQGSNGRLDLNEIGGKGAYTYGVIDVKENLTLFVYVGQKGASAAKNIFNGGGMGQYSGGGATDFRLINSSWDDFDSLKSRIMVAGAGGGAETQEHGGAGGGLTGFSDPLGYSEGGQQTRGGIGYANGTFGCGGGHSNTTSYGGNAGGGGGYFGGGTSIIKESYGGGGGSSFISGYQQCNAIMNTSSNFDDITPSGQPVHFSGISFRKGKMIDGLHKMPFLNSFEIGHEGNGFARVSKYFPFRFTCHKFQTFHGYFSLIVLSCFLSK